MARPATLLVPTKLYSPLEPEGRTFQAGEPWPGDIWSDKPGGEPAGVNATAGLMKDLIEANDRLDKQGEQIARSGHDLAVIGQERDAAVAKVDDLEQRALAAEAAQKTAEDAAKAYMQERDQARADLQAANDRATAAEADHAEKVGDLVAQLGEAHQQLADLTAPPKKAAKADPAPADAAQPS